MRQELFAFEIPVEELQKAITLKRPMNFWGWVAEAKSNIRREIQFCVRWPIKSEFESRR